MVRILTFFMNQLIPFDTAMELYVESPCDKHTQYWFNLQYKALEAKQNSIFIGNPNSPNIQTCSHCGIRFEDRQDFLNHLIDDHNDWGENKVQ